MVIFEQVLRDLVIASNLFADRVFLLRAPQVPAEKAKHPYTVIVPTGPMPMHAHDGPLTLEERDYQFSIFDPSQTKALALCDSLRLYLDGYRSLDYEGVMFGGVWYRAMTWEHEPATELFHVTCEFRMHIRLVNPQPQSVVTTRSNTRIRSYPHGDNIRHPGLRNDDSGMDRR